MSKPLYMMLKATEPTFSASSAAVDVGSSWKRKLPSLDLIRMSWRYSDEYQHWAESL
jgi:hypothetical protein